eukprot:TRINITY_DN9644_c0_g1_i1.p1 TRINITY_DN9644_c0_g1~~TRINITY_DN9644_c0_g1_i1.p1  ORF type:complete len:261 (-),score=40.63 TRINITY_DN9644_c0_g1_i1:30-728(-)
MSEIMKNIYDPSEFLTTTIPSLIEILSRKEQILEPKELTNLSTLRSFNPNIKHDLHEYIEISKIIAETSENTLNGYIQLLRATDVYLTENPDEHNDERITDLLNSLTYGIAEITPIAEKAQVNLEKMIKLRANLLHELEELERDLVKMERDRLLVRTLKPKPKGCCYVIGAVSCLIGLLLCGLLVYVLILGGANREDTDLIGLLIVGGGGAGFLILGVAAIISGIPRKIQRI